MPAGTSWPSYLGAVVGALLSMFAGAQTVHVLYKPLHTLESRVEVEKKRLLQTDISNAPTSKA